MKRIMTRSLVLWFVTFAFLGGIVYLGVMTVWHHNEWVQQPFNGHMASANGLGKAGKIDDRNDKTLAYSENNERYYSDDETTREALLHVIGDEALNISAPGYMYFNGAAEVTGRIIDAVVRISQGEDLDEVMNWMDAEAQAIVEKEGLKGE